MWMKNIYYCYFLVDNGQKSIELGIFFSPSLFFFFFLSFPFTQFTMIYFTKGFQRYVRSMANTQQKKSEAKIPARIVLYI